MAASGERKGTVWAAPLRSSLPAETLRQVSPELPVSLRKPRRGKACNGLAQARLYQSQDGVDETQPEVLLGDARGRARPERALLLLGRAVVGQQEDLDLGLSRRDPRGRLDPVHQGHADVHEDDVGSELAREV